LQRSKSQTAQNSVAASAQIPFAENILAEVEF
jgi:hypothetical protein